MAKAAAQAALDIVRDEPKQRWPADKVSRRKTSSLVPYARNARTHSAEQIAQVARSIEHFGWTTPVLIDESGMIIAGHARVLAAEHLGLDAVPTMVAAGWSEDQKRAYVLADNQLALNAGWDESLLKLELGELQLAGFDLALTGFGELQIGLLLGHSAGLTDPDEAPEPPAEPVSRLGDVWVMGKHRLVCGDCTDAAVVVVALAGVTPHLMVTDPPYGVSYDATWRKSAMPSTNPGKTGGMHGKVENDARADWSEAWSLFPGDVAYVWHGAVEVATVAESLISCGLDIRSQIVWVKHQHVISRGHYHPRHEPCFYAVRKGAAGHWSGDRTQSTVWEIAKSLNNETGHSTQKPVECMRRPIENNSSTGQAVYDPFIGSGTTIIAAEMTGRACHAIELSPAYVDVSVQRWQAFSGKVATLSGDGRSFADISAERLRGA